MERFVTLIGTEQVERAAGSMRGAAEDMNRAANNMQAALEQHQRWMEDWLQRFQSIMEAPRA